MRADGVRSCFELGREMAVIPSEEMTKLVCMEPARWGSWWRPFASCIRAWFTAENWGTVMLSGRPSQPWALWRPRTISSWIALGSLLSLSDAWQALEPYFSLFSDPISWRFHWYRLASQPRRPDATLRLPAMPRGVALPPDLLHWLQLDELIPSTPLCQQHSGQENNVKFHSNSKKQNSINASWVPVYCQALQSLAR